MKKVLIAVNNVYKDKPYFYSLPWDANNRKEAHSFTGAELQKAKKLLPNLMEGEQEVLTNNSVYNQEVEFDKFMIDKIFPLLQPLVALSIDNIIPGKTIFYLQDKEKEAEADVSKEMMKLKAKNKVVDMPENGLSDICLYLGLMETKNYTTNRKLQELFSICEKQPERVLKFFKNERQGEELIWFRRLLQDNVVSKRTGNFDKGIPEEKRHGPGFYYNDRFLGATEPEALQLLKKDSDLSNVLNSKLQ